MSFIPSRLTAQPFTLASLLFPARADAVSHGEARAGSQCRWRRTMSPATGIIERANQQARKTRLVKRTSRHRLCGPARNDDAVHWRTETNVCLRIARFHRPETSENVWRRCSAMRASRRSGFVVLRRRDIAGSLPALERRLIALPKAQDKAL